MNQINFSKNSLLLYAVTTPSDALYGKVEAALRGGVTCVQLREKELSEKDFLAKALALKSLCHRYHVPLIINDNLHVALESGADGIHVGQDDLPVSKIRTLAGRDFIIGVTAKTVAQAKIAEEEGADYLGVGAVFPSPTKKNALRISPAQLREICGSVSIPAVAIGGITEANLTELSGCGMCGIAVVSALFSAADTAAAARSLREKVTSIL